MSYYENGKRGTKTQLKGYISDMVTDFLYYERKECDTFHVGDIEDMIQSGEITVDYIVDEFRKQLESQT